MGRKDRERARKRRAIERARQQGQAPARPAAERQPQRPKERAATRRDQQRGRPGAKGGRRPPPPRNQYATKGRIGDVTTTGVFRKRAVVRTRNMLVHPRITVRVVLLAFLASLPGLVLPWLGRPAPALQSLTFAAFGVCFLGLADLAPTWRQTILHTFLAGLTLFYAVATLVVNT